MRHALRLARFSALVFVGVAVAFIVVAVVFARPADQGYAQGRRTLAATPLGPYNPAGRYVGPGFTNIDPPFIVLGQDQLPRINEPETGYEINPVTISQYGLWAYGAGKPRIVKRVADWLVAHQTSGGKWLYHFEFSETGWAMKPPWSSALAQGQAISLLTRAYRQTGDRAYLSAAVRALRPLEQPVAAGGMRDCFMHDCRLPFYEEYPLPTPIYVLNGFMFTLIGLYDLSTVAPSSDARRLYDDGIKTLHVALPRYEIPGRDIASYDLSQLTYRKGQAPFVPPGNYQAVHVYLLRALDSLFPDPRFARYAALWAAGLQRA